MNQADIDLLAQEVKRRSGLIVGRDKLYLLESRLVPVARRRGLANLDDIMALVRQGADEALLTDIVEAMTTNESFFFRDTKPFEIFRNETLPHLFEARAATRHLRIWSVGCSSGQEPYSIAMLLKEEAARLAGWTVDLIGADLSNEVLEKARAGVYSQFEVQCGLSIHYLMKYFQPAGERWRIDASLRAMVQYRRVNLLDDLTDQGEFDVVFCRNVLMYFDSATKTDVLNRISRLIPTDGALYLGGTETVLGSTERFRPVPGQRGVYGLAA